MNVKLLTALFSLVFSISVLAQNPKMPLHFENDNFNYSFINFSGGQSTVIPNPASAGINTSPTVLRMVKNMGQPWGGSVITLDSALDFSFNNTISFKVWSPRVDVPIHFKVENDTNVGLFLEVIDTIRVANQWTEMSFDFSSIDTSFYYNRIVIIFDFGSMGDGSANFTWYMDDIALEHPLQKAILKTAVVHQVDMSNEMALGTFNPSAHFAVLAGADFWPNCGPVLSDADGDSIYSVVDSMWVGTDKEFKYFLYTAVGGAPNSATPCQFAQGVYESDDFTANCAATVGQERYYVAPFNQNIDSIRPVCFGECLNCSEIDLSDSSRVTFRLNMSNYDQNFERVFVSGDFNNWRPFDFPLLHVGGDFYTTDVTIPPGLDSLVQFKFHTDGWVDEENFQAADPCAYQVPGTSIINRFAIITNDTILPAFCWDSCSACMGEPGEPKEVTFKLDMSTHNLAYTQPYWSGELNSWCGTCDAMTDEDGDEVWEITKKLVVDSVQYKFSYDNWAGEEFLLAGSSCTREEAGGYVNRILRISADTVLPPVCWQSCNDCSVPADSVEVQFNVDITNVTQTYTAVHLNGSFNSWCGDCALMTDTDSNGVFSYIVKVPLGPIQYQFTLDAFSVTESFLPSDTCITSDGTNTNRYFMVTGDTNMPAYCWSTCEQCSGYPLSNQDINVTKEWEVFPNPTDGAFQVMANEDSFPLLIQLRSAEGKVVLEKTLWSESDVIHAQHLSSGNYFVTASSKHTVKHFKLLISQ